MIYRRFTEKAAEEWRQIYKALQLLEFLIKHGSERVIDDARGHLTLLKMLRQFHFIDQNGKDQGINVRNRAKELAELLGDVERIRSERKKARATKNKYTGVEGGTAFGGGFSGASRYGGFGPESSGGPANFGGYSGGVYGDGGGFGGQSSDYQESSSRNDRFEEYDEFEEGDRPSASSRSTRRPERAASKKAAEPPKPKEPEVDLFSFDEPTTSSAAPAAPAGGSGLADLAGPSQTSNTADNDDDEFDDFQSAAPAAQSSSSTQFAAPQPVSAPKQADLSQMMSLSSISPAPSANANYGGLSSPPPAPTQAAPAAQQQSGPNYFGGVQSHSSTQANTPVMSAMSAMPSSTTVSSGPTTMANTRPVQSGGKASAPAAGGDAFGALWGKASSGIKKTNTSSAGPSMGQLAKEKTSASIWGAPAAAPAASPTQGSGATGGGSASGDLLG